jgi:hypothetical protein
MAVTVEDYAKEIGSELRDAYNAKRSVRVNAIFAEAQSNLDESKISTGSQQRFWTLVKQEFFSGQLLFEKQEASDLYRLMRDIEARLAAKGASK